MRGSVRKCVQCEPGGKCTQKGKEERMYLYLRGIWIEYTVYGSVKCNDKKKNTGNEDLRDERCR